MATSTVDLPSKKQLLQLVVEECAMCSEKVVLQDAMSKGYVLVCAKCTTSVQPWFPVSTRTVIPDGQ